MTKSLSPAETEDIFFEAFTRGRSNMERIGIAFEGLLYKRGAAIVQTNRLLYFRVLTLPPPQRSARQEINTIDSNKQSTGFEYQTVKLFTGAFSSRSRATRV